MYKVKRAAYCIKKGIYYWIVLDIFMGADENLDLLVSFDNTQDWNGIWRRARKVSSTELV
jgi:hypothetical protein